MRVVSHPEAGGELEAVAQWYEDRRPGLRDDFLAWLATLLRAFGLEQQRLIIKARLLALFFLLLLIGCQRAAMWPQLKGLDPSLAVVNDPPRLLAIASNYEGPPGPPAVRPIERTIATRHEALRALLLLQNKRFRVALLPANTTETSGIDHICVETLHSDSDTVTLLATPSLLAERKAPEGNYWNLEELTFEKSGKLTSRQPRKP